MTTAICVYCGSSKFTAFLSCPECHRAPNDRESLVKSLIYTDHFFSDEELSEMSEQLRQGNEPTISPDLEAAVVAEVDYDMIEKVQRLSDPEYGAYYQKREQFIVILMIALLVTFICWMINRVVSR